MKLLWQRQERPNESGEERGNETEKKRGEHAVNIKRQSGKYDVIKRKRGEYNVIIKRERGDYNVIIKGERGIQQSESLPPDSKNENDHPGVGLGPENTQTDNDSSDNNHHSNGVYIMNRKPDERATSFFAQPGILAAVIGGAVVGLLCAILVVMFIVYRMRKKDEGSYALDEPKRSPTVNSYTKNSNRNETPESSSCPSLEPSILAVLDYVYGVSDLTSDHEWGEKPCIDLDLKIDSECASYTQVININEPNDCVDDDDELQHPIFAPFPILTMLSIQILPSSQDVVSIEMPFLFLYLGLYSIQQPLYSVADIDIHSNDYQYNTHFVELCPCYFVFSSCPFKQHIS
uniref:Syndecan n=1 Tax=Timema douglasi TaxID=61478 RepID=A0A7R8Z6F2_TIMDO|nr:unnamed protein product [Timema douglasi]